MKLIDIVSKLIYITTKARSLIGLFLLECIANDFENNPSKIVYILYLSLFLVYNLHLPQDAGFFYVSHKIERI